MGKKLYVGNLPFSANEGSLEEFFKENGVKVEKVDVLRDVASGRSRGFGFVELEEGQDLNAAVEATNGKELGGRMLSINEARERSRDSHRGGGSGRGRGGRGGGRGRY
ncbi:MAG TPA: RNA-binding protein [Acidobacteriota bacterium]|jgi:RNA recognition motif-containing protein|nr:RNA-binding protein [Acidobacteriota bacterium]